MCDVLCKESTSPDLGAQVRDINELIRHRETETVRLQKELERIQIELEALRLSAKLLGENETARGPIATTTPMTRETPVYNAAPAARPAVASAPTTNTWASAKQFP
jgi:hypothetical protein